MKAHSSSDKGSINSACSCGKNANGDKYCNLFSHDYYGKKYFDLINDLINKSWFKNCNVSQWPAGAETCVTSYADDDDKEEYLYY
jgi:hypothetical protein